MFCFLSLAKKINILEIVSIKLDTCTYVQLFINLDVLLTFIIADGTFLKNIHQFRDYLIFGNNCIQKLILDISGLF